MKDDVGFLKPNFTVAGTKSFSMSASSTLHTSAMEPNCLKTATNLRCVWYSVSISTPPASIYFFFLHAQNVVKNVHGSLFRMRR